VEFTNELEIRVFGLRRSGNHAIINWLAAQAPSPVHFFNCCPLDGHPFRTNKGRGTREGTDIADIFVRHPKMKNRPSVDLQNLVRMRKDVLLYSFENVDITVLRCREIPHDRVQSVGRSRRRVDVLILRDLFNWMASKLVCRGRRSFAEPGWHKDKFKDPCSFFTPYEGWEKDAAEIGGRDYTKVPESIAMWVTYAREFLGETDLLEERLAISFDRWFVDREFRKAISSAIGFKFTDRGKNIVAAVHGKGSSFDNLDFDGRAEEMKVLERWTELADNRLYRCIFDHFPEAVTLNDRIFRESPFELGGYSSARTSG